jgi:broad-specificity NMP kinase
MDEKIPLFIVTGASGTGKTAVSMELRKLLPDVDVFELDSIHRMVGDDDWKKTQNIWFRVARNVAASGRISIICGTMMPWDAEKCEDYQYFKDNIYFLNLHCDDETRELRLRARNWSEDLIQEHKSFAKWLLENADKAYTPPMPTVDTTTTVVKEVAIQISEWVRGHIIN